jgi:hypothetical protein
LDSLKREVERNKESVDSFNDDLVACRKSIYAVNGDLVDLKNNDLARLSGTLNQVINHIQTLPLQ